MVSNAWLGTFAAAALMFGASPAIAQQADPNPTCRQGLASEWPELLRAAEAVIYPPVVVTVSASSSKANPPRPHTERSGIAQDQPFEDDFDSRAARLENLCQNDREARLALASTRAGVDVYRNPRRAIATLAANPAKPGDQVYPRNLWLNVLAHSRFKDAAALQVAWQQLLDGNEQGLLGSGSWELVEKESGPVSPYAVYRSKGDPGSFIFLFAGVGIGPAVITAQRVDAATSDFDESGYELRYAGCSLSYNTQAKNLSDRVNPPYSELRKVVDAEYAEQLARNPNEQTEFGLLFQANCLQFNQIFAGMPQGFEFDGTEFIDPAASLTEKVLTTWLASESPAKRATAADYVTAHPDAVEPFAYIYVISSLLERGRKQQAAFWYYVFQARSWPWRKTASDPGGYPALHGSIAATLGASINEWAGSDFDALQALAIRASEFERKAPLYPRRPEGVSEAKWESLNAQSRDEHGEAVIRKVMGNKASYEAQRRARGLYVGPWQSPGEPLPESWR